MADKADREQMAKFYEERKGDVTRWKPEGQRPRSRGGVTSVFSVRFTQEELDAVEAAADREEMPISTFIRQAALEASQPQSILRVEISAPESTDIARIRSALRPGAFLVA